MGACGSIRALRRTSTEGDYTTARANSPLCPRAACAAYVGGSAIFSFTETRSLRLLFRAEPAFRVLIAPVTATTFRLINTAFRISLDRASGRHGGMGGEEGVARSCIIRRGQTIPFCRLLIP